MKKLTNGLLAGMMISLGGAAYLAMYDQSRIVGALLFTVGLLTICWFGFSLYTGKIGTVLEKHSKEDISVLLLGLLGNLLATVAFGFLIAYAFPTIKQTAFDVCSSKLQLSYMSVFVRAILCGILVYVSVVVFAKNKTPLGVLLAIPAFILSGYEHSIADMFYFAASGIATGGAFAFIMLVIIGNSLGALIIPGLQLIGEIFTKKPKTADEEQPCADLQAAAADVQNDEEAANTAAQHDDAVQIANAPNDAQVSSQTAADEAEQD